jgi:hypothetical protein
MKRTILEAEDLAPDGVRIIVDWGKFTVGTSFFVPCVDILEAKKQVKKITEDKGWKVDSRLRIEDECFGVRFWRVL